MVQFRIPWVAAGLVVYLCLLLTGPALAGMVGSISAGPGSEAIRADEIRKVQLALENELVRAKLQAYGLTSDEIRSKLDQMSDDQVSLLAQASEKILAGGNGVGLVIGVLVIILLVIVIMKLLNKKIVIG